ncbi:DnaB-like helicase N-terminal domain-containing protein [Streptomyces beigongshangae]|uniref:DnaB-like helicase N-terminal domain-containing protein n=1 Tax=Streptomyces beigongshangae TaxID=2841597 RepID=UPI001C84A009|nr:DnaB-like helicase N-terminal domain-containing protein [Streptomyces sp. REN17]
MPPSPNLGQDDHLTPDTVPAPRAVFHAEQALFGALLLEPHRRHTLTNITAGSFSTAEHTAVFTAITVLPTPAQNTHATNTTWLNQVLATAREQARALTAPYLHALIQVCPQPQHAPAYARMIEAEHAQRRLRVGAERLLQSVHDTSLPHPVHTVLAEADALAAAVDNIATRFPPRAGLLSRTPLPPPGPAPEHDDAAAEEEQALLATAAARPADIGSARWLLPGDFTQPLHAGLWRCLTALDRRHEPVDPVTVLWEAQQYGLLDDGSKPGEILRLLARSAPSLEHWGERILRRSLLATAANAARRIRTYTDDLANTPFQLVVGARRALADLGAVRTRWQHATGAVPPQRPRPASAPRASPPTTTAAHATHTPR